MINNKNNFGIQLTQYQTGKKHKKVNEKAIFEFIDTKDLESMALECPQRFYIKPKKKAIQNETKSGSQVVRPLTCSIFNWYYHHYHNHYYYDDHYHYHYNYYYHALSLLLLSYDLLSLLNHLKS